MKAAQKVFIILALVCMTLIGDSKGVSCGISINGSTSNLIKSVEAGTHLNINCSCGNANHITFLWEINLQSYTEKDEIIDSGTVTINRIISHPVSFICCQRDDDTDTWQCSRPLHINLTQQEMIQASSSSFLLPSSSKLSSSYLCPSQMILQTSSSLLPTLSLLLSPIPSSFSPPLPSLLSPSPSSSSPLSPSPPSPTASSLPPPSPSSLSLSPSSPSPSSLSSSSLSSSSPSPLTCGPSNLMIILSSTIPIIFIIIVLIINVLVVGLYSTKKKRKSGAATVQFNEAYGSLPNTCGMTNIAALKELQASISYDSKTGLKADPVYDTITGIKDNVPTDTATN